MKFFMVLTLLVSTSAFSVDTKTTKTTGKEINTPTAKPKNNEATQLDDLIRGELAALQTYQTVLADTKDQAQKTKLQAIHKDHEQAVSMLSKYVASKPELLEDTQSSGAWGAFTKAWTKGGKLLGNETALKALQQGEEHGINEYEEALKDDTLNAQLKNDIKNKMIPAQKKHIETLKSFM